MAVLAGRVPDVETVDAGDVHLGQVVLALRFVEYDLRLRPTESASLVIAFTAVFSFVCRLRSVNMLGP